jgi:hypothetical protein
MAFKTADTEKLMHKAKDSIINYAREDYVMRMENLQEDCVYLCIYAYLTMVSVVQIT